MELTYTTADGQHTAPDGTPITEGIARAVDRLAYLQGWAEKVTPPDLGAPSTLFASVADPGVTEDDLRDLVCACERYGVKHRLDDGYHWRLSVTIGVLTVWYEARKSTPSQPPPSTAKAKLFAQ